MKEEEGKEGEGMGEKHTKAQEFIDRFTLLRGMVLDVYFNIYFAMG